MSGLFLWAASALTVCWIVVVRGHAGVWLVSVGCLGSHSVLDCGCERACRCLACFCGLPRLSQCVGLWL